ncbi:hypothetical protein [Streptomyces sp. NPDC046887]
MANMFDPFDPFHPYRLAANGPGGPFAANGQRAAIGKRITSL